VDELEYVEEFVDDSGHVEESMEEFERSQRMWRS